MAERRRNQEKLGIVSEKDLTAIVTLERRDSAMSEVVFEAEVGVVHHYLESQKLLFVILSFAVCILNCISVQEVISRILSEPAAAMAFSNYLVIVMVGLDVYYCFLYTLLGIILGMNFYKYVTMLTFGYFLMFVAFDLRLFHLISRIYLERSSVQDVSSNSNLAESSTIS
jgi:CBS domain containing-hemolysin-like protein